MQIIQTTLYFQARFLFLPNINRKSLFFKENSKISAGLFTADSFNENFWKLPENEIICCLEIVTLTGL